MKLSSPSFAHGGKIPTLYTCEGADLSPPLKIEEVPKEAKSLVLIVDDPDVPEFVRKDRMWVHWVVYDLSPETTEIPENQVPPGTLGIGTGGEAKYQGPCPPDREHRYFFKLYALDQELSLPPGKRKEEVEKAMQGHVIAEAVLIGKYQLEIRP